MNEKIGEKFFYKVLYFSLPQEQGPGRNDFSVRLDGKIAFGLKNLRMSDDERDGAIKIAKTYVDRIWSENAYGGFGLDPLQFFEDSWLLTYCTVPGDRCSLGVGQNSLQYLNHEHLDYNCHNVDHPLQAYGLLSIWLKWANAAIHKV